MFRFLADEHFFFSFPSPTLLSVFQLFIIPPLPPPPWLRSQFHLKKTLKRMMLLPPCFTADRCSSSGDGQCSFRIMANRFNHGFIRPLDIFPHLFGRSQMVFVWLVVFFQCFRVCNEEGRLLSYVPNRQHLPAFLISFLFVFKCFYFQYIFCGRVGLTCIVHNAGIFIDWWLILGIHTRLHLA